MSANPTEQAQVTEALLRQVGLRVTPQRITVLNVLRADPASHLDATEIYRKAEVLAPRISLASVYRALAVLRDAGLIHETVVDAGYHRYRIHRPAQDAYVLCGECERVIDLNSPVVQQLREELASRHFRVEGVEIRLSGCYERSDRCDGSPCNLLS